MRDELSIKNNKNKNLNIPRPEELTPALISDKKLENSEGLADLVRGEMQNYFIQDEDRLNEILDKISDYGSDSLTYDERNYLNKYSQNL